MSEMIEGTLRHGSGAGELYLADDEGNCLKKGLQEALLPFVGHKLRIFPYRAPYGQRVLTIVTCDGQGEGA